MSYQHKQGKNSTYRNHLMRNLVSELIIRKKLVLPIERAKLLSKKFDRMITLAKTNTLHSRRLAASFLRPIKNEKGKYALSILFSSLNKKYEKRNGGYSRIIKMERRRGDNSILAIIEIL